jgi:hypothetical protein
LVLSGASILKGTITATRVRKKKKKKIRVINFLMPRQLNRWKAAAAWARKGRAKHTENGHIVENDASQNFSDSEDDAECTKWSGGVNHILSSDSDSVPFDTDTDTDTDSDSEGFEELEGDELLESLQRQGAQEQAERLKRITAYEKLQWNIGGREWKQAESNRKLGYTGNSARTRRRHEKAARDKSNEDEKLRTM